MDEREGRLIPGTGANPRNPFFSPDGKWIGYVSGTDGQVKKVSVTGGAPVTVTDAVALGSLSWGADGMIVFGSPGRGILRIGPNTEPPETILKEGKWTFLHPQILPGGKAVLFTAGPPPYRIMAQSLETRERKELFPGNTARYLPTGHIVYFLENNILAVSFDPNTLRVSRGPVPVIEGVLRRGGKPQYAVSDSGMLVYMPGEKNRIPRDRAHWCGWTGTAGRRRWAPNRVSTIPPGFLRMGRGWRWQWGVRRYPYLRL